MNSPNLNELKARLVEALGIEERTIEVEQGPWMMGDECVSIMVAWSLEDTGGPESGPCLSVTPERWIDVVPMWNDLEGDEAQWWWEMRFESATSEHHPLARRQATMRLEGLELGDVDQVVSMVAGMWKVLGVQQGEVAHDYTGEECGAPLVVGPAHDPYGTGCDREHGHDGKHEGPDPLGNNSRISWNGSGEHVRNIEEVRDPRDGT